MASNETVEKLLVDAFHEEEEKKFFDIKEEPISTKKTTTDPAKRNSFNESERAVEAMRPESIHPCTFVCGRSRGTGEVCCNGLKCCDAFIGGAYNAVTNFRKDLWALPKFETKTSGATQAGRLGARKAKMI
jgi:hypothetical protein